MRKEVEIPEWMKQEEVYVPRKDKNKFLKKTSRQVLAVLSKIKMQTALQRKKEISAGLGLFLMLLTVFLTVCSQELWFPLSILAGLFILLAFLDGRSIRGILGETLGGVAFAVLFTIPAALFGNIVTMEIIVLKTAVTVMAVAILNHSIPWNRMSASLSRAKIPDTLLFVFDMTIKYLVVLGRVCSSLLDALKLRSIGKNEDKKKSAAGVLGVTYLKSQRMAEETYLAMHCRGFDGTYHYYWKHKFNYLDIMLILIGVIEVFVYIYLGAGH